MICAVEGIDASGKKTICALLKERFSRVERSSLMLTFDKVETFDFPHYEGVAGGLVGRVLRGETMVIDNDDLHNKIYPATERLLSSNIMADALRTTWSRDKALLIQCAMLTDRCEFVDKIHEFENYYNRLLILDRYFLSGIVYGQADGLDRDWLVAIHRVLPQPDAFFLLDIPVEESVRRRPDRQDYYEKNLPKLRKVRELYLAEAERDSRICVMNGMLSPETIVEHITTEILMRR